MDTEELHEAEKSLIVARQQLDDCDFDLGELEQQELYKIQALVRDAMVELNKLKQKYA